MEHCKQIEWSQETADGRLPDAMIHTLESSSAFAWEDLWDGQDWLEQMDFVRPAYSKSDIDKAGDFYLREGIDPVVNSESILAYVVLNNWRASHSYPMQIIRNNLANRAKKVFNKAIVAQRLKRFESIVHKLQREPHMKLSQMQDLGGCRAIMPSIADVDELVKVHNDAWRKAPHRHVLHRCRDYIAFPKISGYRGVHLIYKFKCNSLTHAVYNGQRIEVQIRSRLQHAWATAVEIVGAFKKESLKSGQGSAEWQRLFALMGSVIAEKENRPLVPGTNHHDLRNEIRRLSDAIHAEHFLAGCSHAVVTIDAKLRPAAAYVVVLDTSERFLRIFSQESMQEANRRYAEEEKKNSGNPNLQTVLVSVDSISMLKTAYPNYYLDVSQFLKELRVVLNETRD